MYTCVICHFEAELDDVIAPATNGRCVCLRCFMRETGTAMAMPKDLRRDVTAALNSISASWA